MRLTSLPSWTPLDQSRHRTFPGWAVVGGLPGSVTWRLRLLVSSLLPAKKLSRAFEGCWQAVVVRFQMKMFESIDSTTTRSGPDLWAEICSCLPHPDQEDSASNAFSDSFMDSYPAGTGQREAPHFAIQPAVKPWAPLQDSEVYLASLEKKLRRIKGLNQEVTSKDMLRTLAQAKKECWDRFLQEKLASEFFVDGLDSDESTLEHFKRWLQPDKVAISTEEVQYLIPPESQVEKPAPGDEPTAAEQ